MKNSIFIIILSIFLHIVAIAAPANHNIEVIKFIQKMHLKYKFDTNYLQTLFSQVNLTQDKVKKKYKSNHLTWQQYKNLFITNNRIKNGKKFIKKNIKILKIAQQKYGIPLEIIVAILGMETNYGKNQGNNPVFPLLVNKAFTPNKHSKFYQQELFYFLLLCRQQNWHPLMINGSAAGAIGESQFMPSSYMHYAISTNSKHADLLYNDADAILSVANFLHKNYWQNNKMILIPVRITKQNPKLPKNTFKLNYTLLELKNNFDINFNSSNLILNSQARFITKLENHKVHYYLGLKNFYVITRYNHSTNYALAVTMLSKKLVN